MMAVVALVPTIIMVWCAFALNGIYIRNLTEQCCVSMLPATRW